MYDRNPESIWIKQIPLFKVYITLTKQTNLKFGNYSELICLIFLHMC